jgi:adenine phosphoribosyltransferase
VSAAPDPRLALLRARVRDVPDFPKPGILFRDITPLLADARALATSIDLLAERFTGEHVDVVVGVESRGFLFGAPLAVRLGAGFVPVRKPGKLPAAVDSVRYALEYGEDALEMHLGSIETGARALVVDDVIATGGTAAAAVELARRQGAEVLAAAFVIELTFLEGRRRLGALPVVSLLEY